MRNILVIDDEENILDLYKTSLESDGYVVKIIKSAIEGLKIVDDEKFDLIILDIKMPGLSGVDFLKELRAKDANIPVLISSAYPMYKNDFFTWLANDFIVKNPDLTELKQKIKNLIG